jgi:CheY-like chemotaxis protein
MSESLRILIADDEPGLRSALLQVLEGRGHRVETASNGADALERIRTAGSDPYELLITDMHMPVMRGDELVRQLNLDGVPIEILAITGFGDKELVVDLLRHGVREYIDKPFTVVDFLARLDSAVIRVLERRVATAHSSHLVNKVASLSSELARAQKGPEAESRSALEPIAPADLTDLPERIPGLRHALRSRPLNMLGGDFLGMNASDGGYDLLLAEVAGHDVGASIVTTLIRTMFETDRGIGQDGTSFLRNLNAGLVEFGSERMVTACHVRIVPTSRRIEMVTAAHTAPLLVHAESGPYRDPPSCWGDPLGISREIALEAWSGEFLPQDRLFLFSDGMEAVSHLDASSGKWRILGAEGIQAQAESAWNLPLDAAVEAIWQQALECCRFAPSDDLLLLGIELDG